MIYTAIISLSLTLSLIVGLKRLRRYSLSQDLYLELTALMFIFGFLGARLFHVVIEEPGYYLRNPKFIFEIWNGGFVFYGGLIFAIWVLWFWTLLRRQSLFVWGDFLAPLAALSYGLGRLGCFFNGCCFGKTCDYFWCLNFSHPTQLYAAGYELTLLAFLLFYYEPKRRPPGDLLFFWLFGHGLGRIGMELLREDYRGPLLMGLTLSTWISALLLLPFLFQHGISLAHQWIKRSST